MTTWNPLDKGSNIVLSGGDLVATPIGTGGPPTQYVRTTTGKSSGKWVIEVSGDLRAGSPSFDQTMLTIASSTTLDGSDSTSMLLYDGGGYYALRYNGGLPANENPMSSFPGIPTGTDVIQYWVDLDNGLLYIKVNGSFIFNSSVADPDPSVPIGGVSFTTGGVAWYFGMSSIYNPNPVTTITLNPTPTVSVSGWLPWDAASGPTAWPIAATFAGVGGLAADLTVLAAPVLVAPLQVPRPRRVRKFSVAPATISGVTAWDIAATFAGAGGLAASLTQSGVTPQIPVAPVLKPGSSLLTNLLACYLPGVYNGVPVNNLGPTLVDGAGGAGTPVSTVEGPASRANTSGSARGLTGTAPSTFKSWTNFTFYWRGLVIGTGDQFCPVGGVSTDNIDTSPYYLLGISANGSPSSYSQILAFYGDSSTFKTAGTSDVTSLYGQVMDFAVTATVGGNVTFYVNGTSVGTNTIAALATSTSNAQITINQGIDATSRSPNASVNMAAFWDRALSSTEIANLHTNPYSLLITGMQATFAGVGGLTADVTQVTGGIPIAATFNGVGGLTSQVTQLLPVSATFAGVGSLVANTLIFKPITAAFAGVGGLTVSLTTPYSIAATFTGVGSLIADAPLFRPISATFAGVGSLVANATVGPPPASLAATFAGVGGLTADVALAPRTYSLQATFNGVGNVMPIATLIEPITAAFNGLGGMAAATSVGLSATAAFAGVGGLSAQLTQTMSITATFGGIGFLLGSTQKVIGTVGFNGVGGLTANVSQSWAISATFAGAGGLVAQPSQWMQISAVFAGAGLLTVNVTPPGAQIYPLAATFAGVGGLTASLRIPYSIAATFLGAGGLSADTSGLRVIAASFGGVGGLTAATSLQAKITATFNGVGGLAASLATPYSISVTFAGVGGLSANVTTGVQVYPLTATFAGVGGLSANALVTKSLTAAFAGIGSLTAQPTQTMSMTATFAGLGFMLGSTQKVIGTVNYNGVGGLTAKTSQSMAITATFAGNSGLAVNLVAGPSRTPISATFAGAGGLAAQTTQRMLVSAAFAGVGSLTVNVTPGALFYPITATFAGVGGLRANLSLIRFYTDTEVCDVGFENRRMHLELEYRERTVPEEDRSMEVLGEETRMDSPVRERV